MDGGYITVHDSYIRVHGSYITPNVVISVATTFHNAKGQGTQFAQTNLLKIKAPLATAEVSAGGCGCG